MSGITKCQGQYIVELRLTLNQEWAFGSRRDHTWYLYVHSTWNLHRHINPPIEWDLYSTQLINQWNCQWYLFTAATLFSTAAWWSSASIRVCRVWGARAATINTTDAGNMKWYEHTTPQYKAARVRHVVVIWIQANETSDSACYVIDGSRMFSHIPVHYWITNLLIRMVKRA